MFFFSFVQASQHLTIWRTFVQRMCEVTVFTIMRTLCFFFCQSSTFFFVHLRRWGRNFSCMQRQRNSARLRLFCCCCLRCCCLSCVFVLSWLHNRVSGRRPTYLRARASSVERVASSCKVIWFVWARLYIDAGIAARPLRSFFLTALSLRPRAAVWYLLLY